jgi:hypothetical protein
MPASTSTVTVRVRPVDGGRNRDRFIDVPYDFYPGRYPKWVPPLRRDVKDTLDPSSNAFFEHGDMQLFLAEDASGAVVGRIAGIVNGMHLEKHEDATGFFGFFECVEEYVVAEALLDAAADWLREQAFTACAARPIRLSTTPLACWWTGSIGRRPCSCPTTRRTTRAFWSATAWSGR